MRFVFFSLFAFVTTLDFFAQSEVVELPIHLGQYFNNPQLNPAKCGSSGNTEIFAGYKKNGENNVGTNNSFFSTAFRLKSKNTSFNVVGIYFNTDKEGALIRRNRGYGSYARHQQLNDNWALSAGLSLGFYNFGVKSNPVSGGLSGFGFDGNGGIWLYSNKTKFGVSVNQFSNTKVQPLDEIRVLARHYIATLEQTFTVKDEFHVIPSVFVRYIDDTSSYYYSQWHGGATLNFLLNNVLRFGSSYEYNEGFYFFAGIQNINISIGKTEERTVFNKLNVHFSYFAPSITNKQTNLQSFELVLSYFVTKQKKAW